MLRNACMECEFSNERCSGEICRLKIIKILSSGSEIPKAESGHSLIPSVEPRTRSEQPHHLRVSGVEGDTHGTLKPWDKGR